MPTELVRRRASPRARVVSRDLIAVRRGRPVPPRPPLTKDVGHAETSWIGVFTTKHYIVAIAPIATISEPNRRASISRRGVGGASSPLAMPLGGILLAKLIRDVAPPPSAVAAVGGTAPSFEATPGPGRARLPELSRNLGDSYRFCTAIRGGGVWVGGV
jgi:hypothetical protein